MWRRNNRASGLLSHNRLVLLAVTCILGLAVGQYFDPKVTDKVYLDNLQRKIEVEVNVTREELYTQAKVIEDITRQFVAAQLKENLFIALRVLAEKELQQLNEEQNRQGLLKNNVQEDLLPKTKPIAAERQSKQDDGDDDEGDSEGAITVTTVGPEQIGLFPQVANLMKTIFGGNQINLMSYVNSATKLLPKPVENQVVGLVSLLSTDPQTTTPKSVQYRSTRSPAVALAVLPQNNQIGLQNEQEFEEEASPVATFTTNQQENQVKLSYFQDLLANVPQIKEATTAKPKKRTTNKSYVYGLSGSKGVGGVGATVRPLSKQNLKQQSIRPQIQVQQQQKRPQNQFFQPQQQQGQFQGQQGQRPVLPPSEQTSESQNPEDEEDEDYEEDGRRRKRQFSLGNLLPTLLGNVFRTTKAPVIVQSPPLVQAAAAATGTPTGTAVAQPQAVGVPTAGAVPVAAMMAEGFNLRTFAMDVGKNLGDIFKVMPDIFRGAREGVQLLQTLSAVFGGLEGLAGIADIGGIL